MRAADCKILVEKPEGGFRQAQPGTAAGPGILMCQAVNQFQSLEPPEKVEEKDNSVYGKQRE